MGGGGGGRKRVGTKGLTISAYITAAARGREGPGEGPRTGNLLLYTRPEIRMYHSHAYIYIYTHRQYALHAVENTYGPSLD